MCVHSDPSRKGGAAITRGWGDGLGGSRSRIASGVTELTLMSLLLRALFAALFDRTLGS